MGRIFSSSSGLNFMYVFQPCIGSDQNQLVTSELNTLNLIDYFWMNNDKFQGYLRSSKSEVEHWSGFLSKLFDNLLVDVRLLVYLRDRLLLPYKDRGKFYSISFSPTNQKVVDETQSVFFFIRWSSADLTTHGFLPLKSDSVHSYSVSDMMLERLGSTIHQGVCFIPRFYLRW